MENYHELLNDYLIFCRSELNCNNNSKNMFENIDYKDPSSTNMEMELLHFEIEKYKKEEDIDLYEYDEKNKKKYILFEGGNKIFASNCLISLLYYIQMQNREENYKIKFWK